ncbi:outer membrane lipoprotein carrier protein LolA [Bacteroides thetaiotaomicron]|nr:outer membrane lipoprotein carrier protein LolA [Bacteroides thetaiotaomicron]
MKRVLFSLMALCLCLLNLSAQKINEAKVKQQINAVASKMKTMQCDFVQTKYLKMLNDKMVSRGKMYYQQSNKLRWEYTSPYTYTFVLNGSKVLISKGKRNDVINVNQSKFFKEIARIMMNSVVGKCLTDSKDFKVSLTGASAEYVATLYPQQKQMKQMFQKIILHFNKQNSTVSKVELIEKKGDRTIIELKNVKSNAPINAKVFGIN